MEKERIFFSRRAIILHSCLNTYNARLLFWKHMQVLIILAYQKMAVNSAS